MFGRDLTNDCEIKMTDVSFTFGDITGVQPPLSLQQPISSVTDGGNVVFNSQSPLKEDSDAVAHNGTVSSTRPKSVVLEKLLDDGSAVG